MCGIWCCVSENDQNGKCYACHQDQNFIHLNTLLRNRGPDVSSEKCCIAKNHFVHLTGHVLWTQGPQPVSQPFCNLDDSKFLIFNGDIYSFTESEDRSYDSYNENDGLKLFQLIIECDIIVNVEIVLSVIGDLRGPFAFIYYEKDNNSIWFARDFFGRESLLFSFISNQSCVKNWNISSVSSFENVFEIPTAGIFRINLNSKDVTLYPYKGHEREQVVDSVRKFSSVLETCGLKPNFENASEKQVHLNFSTRLKESSTQTCNDILIQLTKCAEDFESPSEALLNIVKVLDPQVTKFLDHLRNSVRLRVESKPPVCKICAKNNSVCENWKVKVGCSNSKVGVLFSGGLDSAVLAYLAADILPPNEPLDLINVAFSKDDNFNNIPDRNTGIESFLALKSIFEPQGKVLNFVTVNIKKSEVEQMRQDRIRNLILPLKSVLDDSLGCCLWFAGRAIGLNTDNQSYVSTARILLLGSGADELLGGYGRHRSAWEKSSWNGLASEMQLEIDRISIRNLGRDNRIVSDHGVCPRMPFLDEELVNFLTTECDLWVKCCPMNVGVLGSRGIGEKILLRAAAVRLFGEVNVHLALFPKRAMQFGSRIAKLENSKEKGKDECKRLL